jgi:flagellar biosynthesis protein FlhF
MWGKASFFTARVGADRRLEVDGDDRHRRPRWISRFRLKGLNSTDRVGKRQEGDTMRLKTFRAFTLSEALGAVKSDLGEHAVILHTRTFKRGGFLGIGGREIVEVIASETDSVIEASAPVVGESDRAEPPGNPELPSNAVAAARAYGSMSPAVAAVRDHPASTGREDLIDLPVSSGSLEIDREKTRKLAQALAIRLERQQAARSSAGVAGPDDVITTPIDVSKNTTAAAVSSGAVRAGATVPVRDEPQRFIIGAGGVLLPEAQEAVGQAVTSAADPVGDLPREPAPRVIELEVTDQRPIPASISDDSNETDVPTSGFERLETKVSPADAEEEKAIAPATAEVLDASPPTVALPGRHDKDELAAIRSTVGRMLENGGPTVSHFSRSEPAESLGRPEPLTEAYASLIAQELSRDLAERVVAVLQDELDPQSLADPSLVRKALLAQVAMLVPTDEDLEFVKPRDGRPRTIAFVGPTGVGKTTTLAKIAATMTLRDGIRVGLVTADTYRIAAVDQLRTYADILGLQLEVASGPSEMRAALDRCRDLDAVLIDTPGRSQNDTDRIADLRALIDAARPHETHLVLSGTAAERVLLREAEAFSTLGPDRVVLTKLDDAVTFGMLVSVVRRIGRRISWVTTGQEVPTDVERATSERLANLILGEPVKS